MHYGVGDYDSVVVPGRNQKTIKRGNAALRVVVENKCRLVGRSSDRLIATSYLVKPSPHKS